MQDVPPTFLQQQGTGLRRATPLSDEVLVELLEADGLEDAMLVILPGEQDKSQGSRPSPSAQWETSTLPLTAEVSASHPAGTFPGDTSPWPQGTGQARHTQNTDWCLQCHPTSASGAFSATPHQLRCVNAQAAPSDLY